MILLLGAVKRTAVFTGMQDEVFPLNVVLKYVRLS